MNRLHYYRPALFLALIAGAILYFPKVAAFLLAAAFLMLAVLYTVIVYTIRRQTRSGGPDVDGFSGRVGDPTFRNITVSILDGNRHEKEVHQL
jgi:hypothetical protein